MTTHAVHELVLNRVFDAPPALVWKAWTTPEHLKQWFAPKPFKVIECTIDLRAGGVFSTTMLSPEGQRYENPGVLLEVVPLKKLVLTDAYTSAWVPSPKPFMTAIMTLEPQGNKTKYVARAVFPMISDLRKFNSWNPFMKMEPDAKVTYSGTSQGRGAAYTWEGAKTGSGRMEITDASTPSKVVARLDFYKPFAATNTAEFTVVGSNGASNVTWAMTGHKTFVPKLMGLFFSMDKMVGSSFEQGLADLKTKVEA